MKVHLDWAAQKAMDANIKKNRSIKEMDEDFMNSTVACCFCNSNVVLKHIRLHVDNCKVKNAKEIKAKSRKDTGLDGYVRADFGHFNKQVIDREEAEYKK